MNFSRYTLVTRLNYKDGGYRHLALCWPNATVNMPFSITSRVRLEFIMDPHSLPQ